MQLHDIREFLDLAIVELNSIGITEGLMFSKLMKDLCVRRNDFDRSRKIEYFCRRFNLFITYRKCFECLYFLK